MADGVVESVPEHVNLKLDLDLRNAIQDFQTRMSITNRSDAMRTLLAIGLRDMNTVPDAIARAAYRSAVMRGLAAIKSSLPEFLALVLDKLLKMEATE